METSNTTKLIIWNTYNKRGKIVFHRTPPSWPGRFYPSPLYYAFDEHAKERIHRRRSSSPANSYVAGTFYTRGSSAAMMMMSTSTRFASCVSRKPLRSCELYCVNVCGGDLGKMPRMLWPCWKSIAKVVDFISLSSGVILCPPPPTPPDRPNRSGGKKKVSLSSVLCTTDCGHSVLLNIKGSPADDDDTT